MVIKVYNTSDFGWYWLFTKVHCLHSLFFSFFLFYYCAARYFYGFKLFQRYFMIIFYFEHWSVANPIDVIMNRRIIGKFFMFSLLFNIYFNIQHNIRTVSWVKQMIPSWCYYFEFIVVVQLPYIFLRQISGQFL